MTLPIQFLLLVHLHHHIHLYFELSVDGYAMAFHQLSICE